MISKIDSELIKKAEFYVIDLLKHQLSKNLVFHSVNHTMDVVRNSEMIGKTSNITEDELTILYMSALFHDVGYIKTYYGHESESAFMAEDFLSSCKLSKTIIRQVTSAIKATKVPQNPRSKIAEMLCDADLMILSSDNYFEQIELLRQEWELVGIAKMSSYDFNINSLNFFKSHHYHSDFGKKVLLPKKEKVLNQLKSKIDELSIKIEI